MHVRVVVVHGSNALRGALLLLLAAPHAAGYASSLGQPLHVDAIGVAHCRLRAAGRYGSRSAAPPGGATYVPGDSHAHAEQRERRHLTEFGGASFTGGSAVASATDAKPGTATAAPERDGESAGRGTRAGTGGPM